MGKVFAKDTTNEPILSIRSRVQTCSEEVNQVVDETRRLHKPAPFIRQNRGQLVKSRCFNNHLSEG
jgi:hypothetical protein